ncbi:glycosyltransferase family 2 protein [Jejudonia soesokkakensis]|uniref:Glycosyltransferase family 2 protein n=1 Tax=Jejudonia soesokkakensis TaxID=1323432 RepID=A0ABW2MU56_9FLAO
MPKFSVVIAVYNKEKYIGNTLQSVLEQTFTDFEIIIVNDGSTDKSETIINSFKDSRISYYSQKNAGAGAARNTAIQKATAPFIALLDADDLWDTTYLEEQNRLILKYPSQHVYACNSKVQDKNQYLNLSYSVPITEKEDLVVNFFVASTINSIINSSTTVLKKVVFETVGFYDTSINSGEDTDLFIRIGLQYAIVFSPKILVTIVRSQESLSQTTHSAKNKPTFEAYEKYEDSNKPLKKFLDLNRFSMAILAKLANEKETFMTYYNKIDPKNLNSKQRSLLKMPAEMLRKLKLIKNFLNKKGANFSAFK